MTDIDKSARYDKWLKAQIKKYGTEDKFRQSMRERGLKAKRNTPRGFSVMRDKDPEKHKELSRRGGNATKRAREEASKKDSSQA